GRTWVEFSSLSASRLTATRSGQQEWFAQEAGVEFKPIDGAPVPAESGARRLAHMRSMVEPFSASIFDLVNGKQELRLLSQPIFETAQRSGRAVFPKVLIPAQSVSPCVRPAMAATADNGESIGGRARRRGWRRRMPSRDRAAGRQALRAGNRTGFPCRGHRRC